MALVSQEFVEANRDTFTAMLDQARHWGNPLHTAPAETPVCQLEIANGLVTYSFPYGEDTEQHVARPLDAYVASEAARDHLPEANLTARLLGHVLLMTSLARDNQGVMASTSELSAFDHVRKAAATTYELDDEDQTHHVSRLHVFGWEDVGMPFYADALTIASFDDDFVHLFTVERCRKLGGTSLEVDDLVQMRSPDHATQQQAIEAADLPIDVESQLIEALGDSDPTRCERMLEEIRQDPRTTAEGHAMLDTIIEIRAQWISPLGSIEVAALEQSRLGEVQALLDRVGPLQKT